MVDFITEVEEELRKDEYNRLLRQYGPYIVGIIAVIIAVTGFMEWREYSSDRAARATSAAFVEATNLAAEGQVDTALAQFLAIADKAPEGYAGLSLMRAAALSLSKGERDEAVKLYDRAATTFPKPRHSQLAQMKAAYILAADARYGDVESRMGVLAEKDAPYEFLARELLGLAALEQGNLSKARQEFSYLTTVPGVPPTIQSRAEQSLGLMQVDAAQARAEDEAKVEEQTVPVDDGLAQEDNNGDGDAE